MAVRRVNYRKTSVGCKNTESQSKRHQSSNKAVIERKIKVKGVSHSTQFRRGGHRKGGMRLMRRGRGSGLGRGGPLGEGVRGHPKCEGSCLPHSIV